MDFTHFNDQGHATMVDVSEKGESQRTAVAEGWVYVSRTTVDLIKTGGIKKGDVLTVAQIAGIMGAKRTPDLIPMCHPLILTGVDLSLSVVEKLNAVRIEATVKTKAVTGVEMEALTAVSVAALTVYDMCKAVQKDIRIADIRLLHKSGGVHGDYNAVD
ncbi:MAG: cyclic pyranopterin monophosphate synthase MoaC [Succinivibrionaceae bacterium]|nr:cyclic pyranopterin monophosphate synthase MoaC [Succinivibrionaceae bacterium]